MDPLHAITPEQMAILRKDLAPMAPPPKRIRAVASLLTVKDAAERLQKATAALADLLEPVLTASAPVVPPEMPGTAGLPVPEHDRIAQGITYTLEKLIEDVQSLTNRL